MKINRGYSEKGILLNENKEWVTLRHTYALANHVTFYAMSSEIFRLFVPAVLSAIRKVKITSQSMDCRSFLSCINYLPIHPTWLQATGKDRLEIYATVFRKYRLSTS